MLSDLLSQSMLPIQTKSIGRQDMEIRMLISLSHPSFWGRAAISGDCLACV